VTTVVILLTFLTIALILTPSPSWRSAGSCRSHAETSHNTI